MSKAYERRPVGRARVVAVESGVLGSLKFQVRLLQDSLDGREDDANGDLFWLRRGWDGPGDPTIGEEGELHFESSSAGSFYRFVPDVRRDALSKRRAVRP